MASAYRDMKKAVPGEPDTGWRASFRRMNSRPGQPPRRVAIPREALAGAPDMKAAADAWAIECERLCRLLERRASPDPALIDQAEAHRAISPEDAQALRDALPANLRPVRVLTLMDAAEAHPSTIREAERNPSDHARHLRCLERFAEFAGVLALADLRLAHATAWVERMRRDGLAWDTRRHALLHLRRASQMGPRWGVPDQLAGLKLDSDEDRRPGRLTIWRVEELRAAAAWLEERGEWRALASLGLGALAGLRPSEILRARVGDLSGGVLAVGERQRKNKWSARELPLAPTAERWIMRAIEGYGPQMPIVAPRDGAGNSKPNPMDTKRWRLWMVETMRQAAGREVAPKSMRKTFATLAIRGGANLMLVESYLGHKPPGGDSLLRSYLAEARMEELRTVASTVERLFGIVSPAPQVEPNQ